MSAAKERNREEPEDIEFVDASWEVHQFYHADPLLLRFFEKLKERQLLAGKAPGERGRVAFPPSSFCEASYSEVVDLVPVGPKGVIRTFTVLPSPSPSIIVFVQLDGADTASPGYLRGVPEEDMYSLDLVGAPCRVVFAHEPAGDRADFWFELVND